MSNPAIDLAAERDRSLARQKGDPIDSSARMLLHIAGWGNDERELTEAAERQYPKMDGRTRKDVIARAQRIQSEESGRRVDPEAYLQSARKDVPMRDPIDGRKLTAEQKETAYEFIATHVDLEPAELVRRLDAERDLPLRESTVERYRKMAQEGELPSANGGGPSTTPAPEPEEPPQEPEEASAEEPSPQQEEASPEPPAPTQDAARDLALSEAVHGDEEAAALPEEVRSRRAADEDEEFVRLEQEDDKWSLRVHLGFGTCAEAARVAGLLFRELGGDAR